MKARRASLVLQRIQASPGLRDKAPLAPAADPGAHAFTGKVRLDPERALRLSAAGWHAKVRRGLFERALVLGADHRLGPHEERPEIGQRLLAHIDALAEAGLTLADLRAFAEEAEIEQEGALWTVTLLHGCLDEPGGEEALVGFLDGLDEGLFARYARVGEIVEALRIQPSRDLIEAAARWAGGASLVRAAVGLEISPADQVPDELIARLARDERPLLRAAAERLVARMPRERAVRLPARPPWTEIASPSLAYEVARARLFAGDPGPLAAVRARDPHALAALGPFAIDLLAIAGGPDDGALCADLARSIPSTPALLHVLGRAGYPSLLPRLFAALDDSDAEDTAHEALSTMLGPRVTRPSRAAWEEVLAAIPAASREGRLRGGEPHTGKAVLEEMRRPDLCERDLRDRLDEVLPDLAAQASLPFGAFGVSLEGALRELRALVR